MNNENLENPNPNLISKNTGDFKPEIEPLISPTKAAFLALVLVFLLYQIGGAILTLAIFGSNFEHADVNAMRLLTMGGQILLILLPALLLSKFIYTDVTTILRVRTAKLKEAGLFILGLIILTPLMQSYLNIQSYIIDKLAVVSPFVNSAKNFLDKLDKLVESTYGNLLSVNNAAEGILVVIVVAVVPAICEETFFRGFVQSSFEFNFKPWKAALITAIFFGIYHFNPYGLLPLIGLGFFLGFAAYKTQSILVPMILHFLNNFIAVILYFIFGSEDIFENTASQTETVLPNIIIFIIFTSLFIALILAINNYYKKQKLLSEEI